MNTQSKVAEGGKEVGHRGELNSIFPVMIYYLFSIVCARWFVLVAQSVAHSGSGGKEGVRRSVESEAAGRGRQGVVAVSESERAPGTTAEVNPSIRDIEPSQVSPPQQ